MSGESVDMEQLMANVTAEQKRHPRWRYGQTVWNVAARMYPNTVELLRGSPIDPFHRDDRVPTFLKAISEPGPELVPEQQRGKQQ